MVIRDYMKRKVISAQATETIGQAALRLVEKHIGTLPVVDDQGILIGLVQLRDLLGLVMPDFVRLIEDFDFVHDFGALEKRKPSPEMLGRLVGEVMKQPTSVHENCGLLRAVAVIQEYRLLDLPVVDNNGKLVGIASRVDIGTALIASWDISSESGE